MGDASYYFKQLAVQYDHYTGRSTYALILAFLKEEHIAIQADYRIHDNACGIGTASLALLASGRHAVPIEATDNSDDMIPCLRETIEQKGLSINAQLMDSVNLSFPDDHFDLSITNISITNFPNPEKALQEIYRTLRPGGTAVVSIWKRFAVADIIHQAQKHVKSDAKLMPIPKAEYMQDGHLEAKVQEAGFERTSTHVVDILVTGEDITGLRDFMVSPLTKIARAGWSEAECEQWPAAIDKFITEEQHANHGIKMSAWFVVGFKPTNASSN